MSLYLRSGDMKLEGFVDSDLGAGDVENRKSTKRYVYTLKWTIMSWVSQESCNSLHYRSRIYCYYESQ